MATSTHDSAIEIRRLPTNRPAKPRVAAGDFWLEGDVLTCACPDCRAPMSVRLWLMSADCWRCGCSFELSIEQERRAREMIAKRERQAGPESRTSTPTQREAPKRETGRREPAPSKPRQEPETKQAAPSPPPEPLVEIEEEPVTGEALLALVQGRDYFRDLPAWLISLIVHLVLMIALGLWTITDDPEPPQLVLTASVGPEARRGGEEKVDTLVDTPEYDLPIEQKPKNNQEREVLRKAQQDARELRLDVLNDPNLPPLSRVKKRLNSSNRQQRMLAARDPRVRRELIRHEGGTLRTEAAVARALRWIAAQQKPEGHFPLDGGMRSDSAGTGLALLAFLGAGQTHHVGMYKNQVSKGLRWLVDHQEENGDLRANSAGNSGMYAHALATIVLCEAFQATGDEALRAPAQRAVNFIVEAQHKEGGWRYKPREPGDLSVVGWQLMALMSAEAAFLHVPEETFEMADEFVDSVQTDKLGGRYGYRPNERQPRVAMTAEGLLCRMYLGWKQNEPGLKSGVDWLIDEHLPSKKDTNMYYWYYGTQVMHHWGGKPWEAWNNEIRDILVDTQLSHGKDSGSWDPNKSPHGRQGGRLYFTALAACTLEVYYRHTPLYRQLDLE